MPSLVVVVLVAALFVLCLAPLSESQSAPHALSPPEPAAAKLQADVAAAIATNKPSFTIPQGLYRFNAQPFTLANARNFTLQGNGATIVFDGLAATGGVLVEGGSDITVRGLVIDYMPAPFYQGTLLAPPQPLPGPRRDIQSWQMAERRAAPGARLHSGAPFDPASNNLGCVAPAETDAGTIAPDTFLQRWLGNPSAEFVQGPQFWKASEGFAQAPVSAFLTPADFVQRCEANGTCHVLMPCGAGLVAGDKVTVVVRAGFTYLLHNATRVTTENVTMHTASFMGFTEFDGQGGHVYRSVRLVRRPASSTLPPSNPTPLVACNADCFHSSGVQRGPQLLDSELSFCIDDYINVHSRVQVVHSRVSNRSLIVADPRLARDYGLKDDFPYGTVETLTNARPGSSLDFYTTSTLTPLGRVPISALTRITDVQQLASINASINAQAAKAEPPIRPLDVRGGRAWRIDFAQDLPEGVAAGTLAGLADWDAAAAVVAGNYLHDNPDGFRWKSSRGCIVNNTWTGAQGVTSLEVSMLQEYLEGPLRIENVTIAHNVLSGPRVASEGDKFFRLCTGMYGSQHPKEFADACVNIIHINNTLGPGE